MSYTLRTLDPAKDENLFKEAYDWILSAPDWVQHIEGVVANINNCYSYEDYLKAAMKPTEFNIGLFNGKLRAVYTIQDQNAGSFQVHVGAERGVDPLALIAGASQLREWLFAHGARDVYGWVASVNRPFRKIVKDAGFAYCGMSVFKGSLNDRPIRWLRFQAVK
jgi:hypothetical protein